MNTTSILKKNLISRIENSNDEKFLNALQTIFDSSEQELYKLSAEQSESIDAGRKDIENGKYKPHSVVMEDLTAWQKKQSKNNA
ncbi:MAG: hypothetical protein LLF81_01715 [Porphyromonadaceae bacterium]|nr:hypothetical protein [Porphyromonadaceae bacterium]